jgi:hypothetical protein
MHVHVAHCHRRQIAVPGQLREGGEFCSIVPTGEELDAYPGAAGEAGAEPGCIRGCGCIGSGCPDRETIVEIAAEILAIQPIAALGRDAPGSRDEVA